MASGQRDSGDRAALGEDGRDSSGQYPGAQDPAPLNRNYVLSPENAAAVNTGTGGGRPISLSGNANQIAVDVVNRRPQLMEWAIGKGYDRFMEGTGKLVMPGEKNPRDQHIHAAGEEITSASEIGLWLYPKGQEPKKRSYLIGFSGLKNGTAGLDIPPN